MSLWGPVAITVNTLSRRMRGQRKDSAVWHRALSLTSFFAGPFWGSPPGTWQCHQPGVQGDRGQLGKEARAWFMANSLTPGPVFLCPCSSPRTWQHVLEPQRVTSLWNPPWRSSDTVLLDLISAQQGPPNCQVTVTADQPGDNWALRSPWNLAVAPRPASQNSGLLGHKGSRGGGGVTDSRSQTRAPPPASSPEGLSCFPGSLDPRLQLQLPQPVRVAFTPQSLKCPWTQTSAASWAEPGTVIFQFSNHQAFLSVFAVFQELSLSEFLGPQLPLPSRCVHAMHQLTQET